jgi:radical SAM protein with 4Fe4S-binding SPASM domain
VAFGLLSRRAPRKPVLVAHGGPRLVSQAFAQVAYVRDCGSRPGRAVRSPPRCSRSISCRLARARQELESWEVLENLEPCRGCAAAAVPCAGGCALRAVFAHGSAQRPPLPWSRRCTLYWLPTRSLCTPTAARRFSPRTHT